MAARKQKQQKEAEERVLTDPSEGGFVKQGPDISEAGAVPLPAKVAELTAGDILADSLDDTPAAEAAKHAPSAGLRQANAQPGSTPSVPHELPENGTSPAEGAAVKSEPDLPDSKAAVKLEEAGEGPPNIKMEEASDLAPQDAGAEKQLRQMGMFSSGRSNTKGVANALIEKRKSRQRKAGTGAAEDSGRPGGGQPDASGSGQASRATAAAQQNGKADNGVCIKLVIRLVFCDGTHCIPRISLCYRMAWNYLSARV